MAANPTFFISQTKDGDHVDTCRYGDVYMTAANNSMNGGLCAYEADRQLIYACPAPDSICWALAPDCTGGNSVTPGTGQIRCGQPETAVWCCDEAQDCTQAPRQINVCWGKFENPNKGLSPEAANQLQSSSLAAIESAALSSRLTAMTAGISATTTLSTITTGGGSAGLTASAAATAGPSAQPSENTDSTRPSVGAIAGIAVGSVIAGVLIGIGLFYTWQRKKKTKQMAYEKDQGHGGPYGEMPASMARYEVLAQSKAPPLYGSEAVHEMPHQSKPVEMPVADDEVDDRR
ncbi:hypothetical protein W97_04948 [Coniosporium apollinis CBS 100218]|uniref:Mid2 domain-containing protein n=1 Tax=Coniosporium apollinis (strain CBS 100218) TaxID=1168221 RepID=R7YV85_CONA1|nr:uncharacterized protein W97_04948 [Coniosporium apollinis CBS 100218]EON65709.1 hypothetical protein W97_04948 [Coniosporium apollinis CBS 100218]